MYFKVPLKKYTTLSDIQWYKKKTLSSSMNAYLKPQEHSPLQHRKSQSEYTQVYALQSTKQTFQTVLVKIQ